MTRPDLRPRFPLSPGSGAVPACRSGDPRASPGSPPDRRAWRDPHDEEPGHPPDEPPLRHGLGRGHRLRHRRGQRHRGDGRDSAALGPDGSRLYVTDSAADTVSVVNTRTRTVVKTVGVGHEPSRMTVSPDNRSVSATHPWARR
ncbi:YncE family protein [Streptomyces sp. F8]|uniref:YncE family protein n=1 Tax=Streptomyces sp. F8 TaxID=1436085 RepID=UPI003FA79B2F